MLSSEESGPFQPSIEDLIAMQIQPDDVFSSDFLGRVCIQCGFSPVPESREVLIKHGQTDEIASRVDFLHVSPSEEVAPGPYALGNSGINEIWKFFEDTHEAFTTTLLPDKAVEEE